MQTITHNGKRYGILGPLARLGRDGVVRDRHGEPLKGRFVSADRAAAWAPPPPKPKKKPAAKPAAAKPARKRAKKGGK